MYCHTIISTAPRTLFHALVWHAFVVASDVSHSQSKTQLATFMQLKWITNIASSSLTIETMLPHWLLISFGWNRSSLSVKTSDSQKWEHFECLIKLHQHPSTCTHTEVVYRQTSHGKPGALSQEPEVEEDREENLVQQKETFNVWSWKIKRKVKGEMAYSQGCIIWKVLQNSFFPSSDSPSYKRFLAKTRAKGRTLESRQFSWYCFFLLRFGRQPCFPQIPQTDKKS